MPPKKKSPLVNAAETARQHPDTFHIPSPEEIQRVRPHWNVNVIAGGERFWVKVFSILAGDSDDPTAPEIYMGMVNNILLFPEKHSYDFGEDVEFIADNIIEISGPANGASRDCGLTLLPAV